jgi:Arf-GAP/SH3 domain/ANK repeat/PH domain-containing protein
LRFDHEDELEFHFTFITRQTQSTNQPQTLGNTPDQAAHDISISGLTFAHASNPRDLDTLVTREFHADPNLHKNSNVQLIGDYSTNGNSAIQYDWSWKWRPPKASEDKGGGYRNSCSFLEYDSKAHRLNTLASFSFWVSNTYRISQTPMQSPRFELNVPVNRNRLPSSQSIQSAVSDSEGYADIPNPPSPNPFISDLSSNAPVRAPPPVPPVVDVLCQRPGEDMTSAEDGPVFRATMKSLEQKTGNMRVQIKKVLRKAEAAQQAQAECNMAMRGFLQALPEASASNASAFKPALDHYFNRIAQRILQYEIENSSHLQKQIIEPLSKLYNMDIKQAESKKKDFEDESRDYYAYVGRYLGQRQDSLKDKKRAESDSKYQTKRRNFELKRFDYSSFMQDLHGGRKEQELLSQLTKYADGQAKSFLATARQVESLTPQLDALVKEVADADKAYKFQRTEREEKRRNLEKNSTSYSEPDHTSHALPSQAGATGLNSIGYTSEPDLGRADSTGSQLGYTSAATLSPSNSLAKHTNGHQTLSPVNSIARSDKFKGIRDLEERDLGTMSLDRSTSNQQRKEGLLWALSKPGSHIDPVGINKQAWHKFWIVLDQGKLSEYSNWKDKLDLHREPIDLRMASVRIARDAERRFCFEVITPQYKRIYQATTEDEMNNWISSINNALQSAVEGRIAVVTPRSTAGDPAGRDIGSILTGKSSSQSGPHGLHYSSTVHGRPSERGEVNRRVTVGARPSYVRSSSSAYDENPTRLLEQIRAVDQGNAWCADCNSNQKVEWVSINLGIILCIECSGIHRSLGTHISKIRSLTLDIHSFTTDIVEVLLLVGNRVSNMVWEATLQPGQKPPPTANRDARLKFITAKYVERAFVAPLTTHASPDETLLTSIKRNEVQGVLHGIALRASPNTLDRSRNTHAVFLALAAADPALPASASPLPSPNGSKAPSTPIKAFPVAELLVQNGAEIPAQLPAIPLSAAAKLYIEQRTARITGTGLADTLGPLPVLGGRSGGFSGPLERDQGTSRLQKRGSAGARFAGKVAAGLGSGGGG